MVALLFCFVKVDFSGMRICQYISWCALIIEIGGLLLGQREAFVSSSLLSAGVTMGTSFSKD